MKKNSIFLSLAFAAITGLTLSSCEKETLQPYVKNNKVAATPEFVSQRNSDITDDRDPAAYDSKYVIMRDKKIKTPMEQPNASGIAAGLPAESEK